MLKTTVSINVLFSSKLFKEYEKLDRFKKYSVAREIGPDKGEHPQNVHFCHYSLLHLIEGIYFRMKHIKFKQD